MHLSYGDLELHLNFYKLMEHQSFSKGTAPSSRECVLGQLLVAHSLPWPAPFSKPTAFPSRPPHCVPAAKLIYSADTL